MNYFQVGYNKHMELQKIVAKNVERIRGKLSRNELAKLSGVSYKHIYDIEEELRNPSLDVVEKIAVALNVKPFELLNENSDALPAVIGPFSEAIKLLSKINHLDKESLDYLEGAIDGLLKGQRERQAQNDNSFDKA